jgi:hypothetical protein
MPEEDGMPSIRVATVQTTAPVQGGGYPPRVRRPRPHDARTRRVGHLQAEHQEALGTSYSPFRTSNRSATFLYRGEEAYHQLADAAGL